MITIIGIGINQGHLSINALDALKDAKKIVLQTKKCYLPQYLDSLGITYTDFDCLYEQAEDFDSLNEQIANKLVSLGEVVYAFVGSPIGTQVLQEIVKQAKVAGENISLMPSISIADCALASCANSVDLQGIKHQFAHDLEKIDTTYPLIITQMDNCYRASEVKLHLGEYYNDQTELYVAQYSNKAKDYELSECALCSLDMLDYYDHLTCVIIKKQCFENLQRKGINDLIAIISKLREPGGCPWDIKQTFETLRNSLLEEAFEIAEAVDLQDEFKICEELGDMLLVIFSYIDIAKKRSLFTLRDVTTEISDKLIFRHPHVFANTTVKNVDEVLQNWEQLKRVEKGQGSTSQAMKQVCKTLPALSQACKVLQKAAGDGFDWDNATDALKKIYEEAHEVAKELNGGDNILDEVGDLLFSAVNVARLCKVDPEQALVKSIQKFITRYEVMEQLSSKMQIKLNDMSLKQLDELWTIAKKTLVK